MKIEIFLENLDEIIEHLVKDKHLFLENMKHIKLDDKKFSEWMIMYLAWNELGSEEDIANFYWELDEE